MDRQFGTLFSKLTIVGLALSVQALSSYGHAAAMPVASALIDERALSPSMPVSDLSQANALFQQALMDSAYFDDSSEIQEFLGFMKTHHLERQMAENMRLAVDGQCFKNAPQKSAFFLQDLFGMGSVGNENEIGLRNSSFFDEQEFAKIRPILIQMAHNLNGYQKDLKQNLTRVIDEHSKYRERQIPVLKEICENGIDWSSRLPEVRRSQSDTGWCYAFTTADLLSFLTGQVVSPIDLVRTYQASNIQRLRHDFNQSADLFNQKPMSGNKFPEFDYFHQGGEPEVLLQLVAKNGFCLDKDAVSQGTYQNGEFAYMGRIGESINRIGQNFYTKKISEPEAEAELEKLNSQGLFPNANLLTALQAVTDHPTTGLYLNLIDQSCKHRIPLPDPIKLSQVYRVPTFGLTPYFVQIINGLKNGPVILKINDGFIYGHSEWGRGDEVDHTLLLTGYRWNPATEHCEIKIRNSQSKPIDLVQSEWFPENQILLNSKEGQALSN